MAHPVGHPIERMQPSSTTINRPKAQPTTHYTQTTPKKYPTATPQYKAYKTSSGNIVYKPSSTSSNMHKPSHSSNPNYRALAAMAKTKSDSNKYLCGVVVVAPQNESTQGWIYCKATNNMYQLPYSNSKHYIPEQIVLFNPTSKLRGLSLTEARSLMMQNKLNINNYKNYFVSEAVSHRIYHTKLYKLSEIHCNYLTEDSESMHNKSKFILNTFLDLRENDSVEFKLLDNTNNNTFPMSKIIAIMERYLNGFINNCGGTIYFGIGDDGRIYGQSLYNINERKIIDEIQMKLVEKLREWEPKKYIQTLIKSLSINIIDVIKIDNKGKCGYIMPNKKIICAKINCIYDEMDENKQIVFNSSKSNNNVVYVRQLSSLCAYNDIGMQQPIGRRQINKLNRTRFSEFESDSDCESEIDFDDNNFDDDDWVTVDQFGKGKSKVRYGNSYKNVFGNGLSYAKSFMSKYT